MKSLKSMMGASLCVLCLAAVQAEEAPYALEQLPEWARTKWLPISTARGLEVSMRLNPFVWKGDFDADGRQDLSVFVRETRSGKEGIAILFRSATPSVVIGAGTDFGNGGDDFSWLDYWTVVDSNSTSAADRLLISKESSASAEIAFHAGVPRWRQVGD